MVHPIANSGIERLKTQIRVIHEHQQLNLSPTDREVFIQALLNPSSPSENLLSAVEKYKKGSITAR